MPLLGIEYDVFVQGLGWTGYYADGMAAGTTGLSRQIEAVRFRNLPPNFEYNARFQHRGWTGWLTEDQVAGEENSGKGFLAAVFIDTSGSDQYDIWARYSFDGHAWSNPPVSALFLGTKDDFTANQQVIARMNPATASANESGLMAVQTVQAVRVTKGSSRGLNSTGGKEITAQVIESLSEIQCVITVGMVAAVCAETAGIACVLTGLEPGVFSCAQAINNLGTYFPGEVNYPVVNGTVQSGDSPPLGFPSGGLQPAPHPGGNSGGGGHSGDNHGNQYGGDGPPSTGGGNGGNTGDLHEGGGSQDKQ